MTLPSAATAVRRVDAKLADMADGPERRMLQNWRDHYHAEAIGDLDATMATMPANPYYRFYGSNAFGDSEPIETADAARAMYQSMIDQGLIAAAPFEDERIAFGDSLLVMEATFTNLFPGAMLVNHDPTLEPERLYRVRWKMANFHPYTPDGLMAAKILYSSAPLSVEPAQEGDYQRMLGYPA